MTVHRIYSLALVPAPVAALHAAVAGEGRTPRRSCDAIKPDVIHFQSHIVVGRGLATVGEEARHPPGRHEPHHAGEHPAARRDPAEAACSAGWRACSGARRASGSSMADAVTTPTRRARPTSSRRAPASRRARDLVRHRHQLLHGRLRAAHREPSSPSSVGSTRRSTSTSCSRRSRSWTRSSTCRSRSSATARCSKQLEARARELGIADRVHFRGTRHRRGAARAPSPRRRCSRCRRAPSCSASRRWRRMASGLPGRRRGRDGAAAPRAPGRERLPLRAGRRRRARRLT